MSERLLAIHLRRQKALEAVRKASTGAGGARSPHPRPSYAPQLPTTHIPGPGELQEPQKREPLVVIPGFAS